LLSRGALWINVWQFLQFAKHTRRLSTWVYTLCFPISPQNIQKISFGIYVYMLVIVTKTMKKGHRMGQRTAGSFLVLSSKLLVL
jgi:hypothetical protein